MAIDLICIIFLCCILTNISSKLKDVFVKISLYLSLSKETFDEWYKRKFSIEYECRQFLIEKRIDFSSKETFDEWYKRKFTYIDEIVLNQFLDEKKEIGFSSNDIKFFNNIFEYIFYDEKFFLINSLLSNEDRVLFLIQVCNKNQNLAPLIIKAISYIIYEENEYDHYNRINLECFLYKNFDIELLKKYNYTFKGIKMFYFLCCYYQGIYNDDIKFCDSDFKSIESVPIFLKKFQSNFKYNQIISFLMRCQIFREFSKEKMDRFYEKIKNFIIRTDNFLKTKLLWKMLYKLSCPLQRTMIQDSISKIKENYTHFVLKKIILPRIKKY